MAPGKVLDISQDAKNLGNVVLYEYHQAPNQHFKIVPCGDDKVFIQSQLSNKVLTVYGHNAKDGAIITEEANNNGDAQKFKINPAAYGEFIILTFCGSALDIFEKKGKNDAPIIQWPIHGESNQIWKIK